MANPRRLEMLESLSSQLYKDLCSVPVDVHNLYPDTLATDFTTTAKSLNTSPIFVGAATISALAATLSKCKIHATKNHSEPVIIFSALLGKTGAGKV